MSAAAWVLFLMFPILLLAGVPIAFAIGIACLFAFLTYGDPIYFSLISQRMFTGVNQFTIMAIPFFFLAAELMTASRVTHDLIRLAEVSVGKFRGALAHVNVIASAFFAGISGSAIADVAGLGSAQIRAMTLAGYEKRFAAALTVASSLIGPLIPPSIIMVLYGSIMQVSIAALFLGGIVPGLLMTAALMSLIHYLGKKHRFPIRTETVSLREFWSALKSALLALLMPAIILGGILSGAFTATEAAAVAVFYAFLLGFVVKRTIRLKDIPVLFRRVYVNTAVVFMVLATASIFAWIIGLERIPESLAGFLIGLSENPYVILLLMNLLLLLVGMFMDIGAAVIVLAPILAPAVLSFGIDPVHFGIVMSLNLVIGLNTPPIGPCLFVAASITNLKIEEISRALAPFYLLQVAILLAVTFVPQFTLFLPRFFGYIA